MVALPCCPYAPRSAPGNRVAGVRIRHCRQGCRAMRYGQAMLLGLLTALLVGCAHAPAVRPTSWLDRWRPFHGPSAADVIEVQVALVERPPGDPFLNHELWTLADEQIVPLERKALLEENGFRVGQLGGNTPARLLTLLTSEQSNVNPRRLLLHSGQ